MMAVINPHALPGFLPKWSASAGNLEGRIREFSGDLKALSGISCIPEISLKSSVTIAFDIRRRTDPFSECIGDFSSSNICIPAVELTAMLKCPRSRFPSMWIVSGLPVVLG